MKPALRAGLLPEPGHNQSRGGMRRPRRCSPAQRRNLLWNPAYSNSAHVLPGRQLGGAQQRDAFRPASSFFFVPPPPPPPDSSAPRTTLPDRTALLSPWTHRIVFLGPW